MPLTTVEPTRLYRQIADQIATLIDRGEFVAGAPRLRLYVGYAPEDEEDDVAHLVAQALCDE